MKNMRVKEVRPILPPDEVRKVHTGDIVRALSLLVVINKDNDNSVDRVCESLSTYLGYYDAGLIKSTIHDAYAHAGQDTKYDDIYLMASRSVRKALAIRFSGEMYVQGYIAGEKYYGHSLTGNVCPVCRVNPLVVGEWGIGAKCLNSPECGYEVPTI